MGQLIAQILSFRVTVNISIYCKCTLKDYYTRLSLGKYESHIHVWDNKTRSQETRTSGSSYRPCNLGGGSLESLGWGNRTPVLQLQIQQFKVWVIMRNNALKEKKKKKNYEETSRALEMETNACKINSSSYPETTPPKRAAKGQNGNAPTKRSGGGVRCSHPLVTFLDHLNQSSRAHSKPPTGPSLAGQRCWC